MGTAGSSLIDSCAEYVRGESGGRQGKSKITLPVALGETVDGHKIGIANRISAYAEPGTYEKDALGAVDGAIHVDVDQKSYQPGCPVLSPLDRAERHCRGFPKIEPRSRDSGTGAALVPG